VIATLKLVGLPEQIEAVPEITAAVDTSFTVTEIFELEEQFPLVIVQVKVYTPEPPSGVKVAVGLAALLNCDTFVLGPVTVQAPVPKLGSFAAKVKTVPKQSV
jgi:hypothetical protein